MARNTRVLKTLPTSAPRAAKVARDLNTKGLVIAHEHPTPRHETAWACADTPDPEVFHPTDPATLAYAQTLCAPCPLRETCLELGLARGEWGVWGGVLLEGGVRLDAPRKPGRPRTVTVDADGSAA